MALKNRQNGKVEIFVGTDKISPIAKNIIEFDELALKTDLTAGIEVTAQTTGFTITKGTTPKTLTVALDANVSGTNTGDETKAGLITKLGIPTAVDDTAAAALVPVVAVGELYYTGSVFRTRQA